MKANKFDGWLSNSFLTRLICLQCNDNDLGGGVVTRDFLYEPEKNKLTLYVILFKTLSGTRSAMKKLLSAVHA